MLWHNGQGMCLFAKRLERRRRLNPAGYFLATRFQMRYKDIIFASNALSVEATKFLNFVSAIVGSRDVIRDRDGYRVPAPRCAGAPDGNLRK